MKPSDEEYWRLFLDFSEAADHPVMDVKWEPHSLAFINPLLTPENVQTAGPCSDPTCPACAPSDTTATT